MDTGIPPAVAGGAPGSDSKDRGGLRRIAAAAGENGSGKQRGPYKCRRCGNRHGEGVACSSDAAKAAAKPARAAASAPAPRPDLFTSENTARLVRIPFALAAIRTNCAPLALDDKQEKELSTVGAVVLNEWVAFDPKYVALALFAISLAGVAFEKVLIYSMWLRHQELELEREKLRATNRPSGPAAPVTPPPAAAPAFGASATPPPPQTT